MLRTNLQNQVRQTPLPKWKPLIPVFEPVVNSIQAIRDLDRDRRTAGDGRVVIEIEREPGLLKEALPPISGFKISDNGVGFNDQNFDSFNTSYSDYKLKQGGKGVGRFTWLKALDRAEIDSTFQPEAEPPQRRRFVFDENYDPDKALPSPAPGRPIETTVHLSHFKDLYRAEFPKRADQLVLRIVEHFLLIFMEPDCPKIIVCDQGLAHSANDTYEKDFKTVASVHTFNIKDAVFTLHGFRLSAPRTSKHKLVYAANQRGVISDNLSEFMPNLTGRLTDKDGDTFVYLGIVQSPYLTEHVNPARTDFDLSSADDADVEEPTLFADEIRRSDIRDRSIEHIQIDLAQVLRNINEAKEERIRSYVQDEAPQYKILMKYSGEFIDRIPPLASKTEIEVALHKELYQREVKLKQEGSRIIKEAEKVDDYAEYHKRISVFMANYNELGVSALAQYITHRRIIIDFLDRAISIGPGQEKYPLEEVVHQLVFPMRRTSEDIPYHEQNLWLIDERLTFHSFIASDKPLSSHKDFTSDSTKRPDLFIYDRKIIFSEGEQPINSVTNSRIQAPRPR
jgi:hypothetical protein